MIPLRPPFGPLLIDTNIFGFPIAVRWYGVMIVLGALLAARVAAGRAERRGFDPEHVWNQLMIGMVLGVLGGRLWYVAFEWERFAGQPIWNIINPTWGGGGLAIHGAIVGAVLSAVIYTAWQKLPFVRWVDICLPTMLIGQGVGRWGNFFNQEAYGRPTTLPIGVDIAPEHRLPPYNDFQQYPAGILFHATFLYESIWNLTGFGVIMWLERRLRGWLRTGDVSLMYFIWYGIGRFFIESLRTDSLCTNGIGGSCDGALRTAQVVSVALVVFGVVGMILNHRRTLREEPQPSEPVADASVATSAPGQ